MPPCAGPIKARPFGWPRRTRPALTGPARGGCEFSGRDERMLAARVEPKNRRKFKPLVLGQYQTAADNLPRSSPLVEGTLRQNQWSALAVRATTGPNTLGRPHHGPAVSHGACAVQALLCRQAAL